jgi:hypothetical protein
MPDFPDQKLNAPNQVPKQQNKISKNNKNK